MSICWFCHWGWATKVRKIYNDAIEKLSGDSSPLHFGPSHIVWEDENFEDSAIDHCLERCDSWQSTPFCSVKDVPAVRESLLALKQVPTIFRQEPEGYDGENPKNFPPPAGYKETP